MNDDYLTSIWNQNDETQAHSCLEEIFVNQGFEVKNFHKKDRRNEKGLDLLCTKGDLKVGIAVKTKPVKSDIKQLITFSKQKMKKIYVYMDHPSSNFRDEMSKYHDIEYWNWKRLHEELIQNSSKTYIMLYFSVHPLIVSYSRIYQILYENRDVRFKIQKPTFDEFIFLWNIKDDAVKLKSILDYLKNRLGPEIMEKTIEEPTDFINYVNETHNELDRINSLAGEVLLYSFERMAHEFPHLLGHYWDNISQRTGWKFFTSKSVKFGKDSRSRVNDYILYKWVLPDTVNGKYSSIMKSFYSTLNCILENTFSIANDLEDGVDWIYTDLIESYRT